MPKTILVVEDDRDLCTLLEYNLSRSGYLPQILERLDGAFEKAVELKPDLVILDVMLPDGDGFDFCRQLRSYQPLSHVPILFLTARSQETDRIHGLEIGGDDYITKPFSPRELMARIKANLRRSAAGDQTTLDTIGPFKVDRTARRVFRNGEPVELTATEFRLLEFFFANPGKAFSREQILRSIWGDHTHVTPRNVDVHIRRLRERLEESPESPKYIQTVRGFGYRFESPA